MSAHEQQRLGACQTTTIRYLSGTSVREGEGMGSPTARQFRYTRELGGEVVVFDDGERIAHHLTAEAAAVWRACDGRSDAVAIAARTQVDAARVEALVDEL